MIAAAGLLVAAQVFVVVGVVSGAQATALYVLNWVGPRYGSSS